MKAIKIMGAAALAICLSLMQAHAALIDLNPSGIGPKKQGEATITAWLSSLVSNYNATHDSDLPVVGQEIFRENADGPDSGIIPSNYPRIDDDQNKVTIPVGGYNYVVLHWGGKPTVPGKYVQAYYIGDLTSPVTLGDLLKPSGANSLSYYSVYSPVPPVSSVPEPSTMITGLFLVGGMTFSLLRRKPQIS